MFIEEKKIRVEYTRTSKLKKSHTYTRVQTVLVFQCDACQTIFERNLGQMDSRRRDNHYHHVCSNCDSYRFAQKKGVERRKIWDLPIDSDLSIGRL